MDSKAPTSIKFTAEKYKNSRKKKSGCVSNLALPDDKMKSKDLTEEVTCTEYVFVCDSNPDDKYCLRGRIVRNRKTTKPLESDVDKFEVQVCPKKQIEVKRLCNWPPCKGNKANKGTKSYGKSRSNVKHGFDADAIVSEKDDAKKHQAESCNLKVTVKNCHDQTESKSKYEVLSNEPKFNHEDNFIVKSPLESNAICGGGGQIQTSKEMIVLSELKCQFCSGVFKNQADLEYHYFHHFGSFEELFTFLNELRSNREKLRPKCQTSNLSINSSSDIKNSQNVSMLNFKELVSNDGISNGDGNRHVCEQPKEVLMEENIAHFVGNIAANVEGTVTAGAESCEKRKTKCNGNKMSYDLLNSESKDSDEKISKQVIVEDVTEVIGLPNDQETNDSPDSERDTSNEAHYYVQMKEVLNKTEDCVDNGKGVENVKLLRQKFRNLFETCGKAKTQSETDVSETSVHEIIQPEVDKANTEMLIELKNNASNDLVKQGSNVKAVRSKDAAKDSGSDTCEKVGFTDAKESDIAKTNCRIKRKPLKSSGQSACKKLKSEKPEIHNSLISTSSHCLIEDDEPKWIFRCSEKETPQTPLCLKKLRNISNRMEADNSSSLQRIALKVPQCIDRLSGDKKSTGEKIRKGSRKRNKQDLDRSTKPTPSSSTELIKNSEATNTVDDSIAEGNFISQFTKAKKCNKKYERQNEVQLKLFGMRKQQQDQVPLSDSVCNFWSNNDTLDSGFGSTPCVADDLSVSDGSSSSYCSSIIDDGDSISINFLEDVNDKKKEEKHQQVETQINKPMTNSFSYKNNLDDEGEIGKLAGTTRGPIILDELDLSEHSDSSEANDNDEQSRHTENQSSIEDSSMKVNPKELETSNEIGTSSNVNSRELDICKKEISEVEANAGGGKPENGLNKVSDNCDGNSQPSQIVIEDIKSSMMTRQKLKNGGCTKTCPSTKTTGDKIPRQRNKSKANPLPKLPCHSKVKCSTVKMNEASDDSFYHCEKCNRRYKSVASLHRHWLDNEHYNLTLEPITYNLYTCLYCDKKFMTKLMINLHLRTCCDKSKLKVAEKIPNELVCEVGGVEGSQNNSDNIGSSPELKQSSSADDFDKQILRQHTDEKQKLVLCLERLKMANFRYNRLMYEFTGSSNIPCWKVIGSIGESKSEVAESEDTVESVPEQPCGTEIENKVPVEVSEVGCGSVNDQDTLSTSEDVVNVNDKLGHVENNVEMKEEDHTMKNKYIITDILESKDNAVICASDVTEDVGKEEESKMDSSSSATDKNLNSQSNVTLLKKSEFIDKGKLCKIVSPFLTEFEKALIADSDTLGPKKVRRSKTMKIREKKMDVWVIPKPKQSGDAGTIETKKHFNASKTAQKIFSKDQRRAKAVSNDMPVTMYQISTPFVRQKSIFPMTKVIQSDSELSSMCQDFNIRPSLPQKQVNDCKTDQQVLSIRSLKRNLKSALGLKNPCEDDPNMKSSFSTDAVTFSSPLKKQKDDDENKNYKLPSFSESFSKLRSASKFKNFKQSDSFYSMIRLSESSDIRSKVQVSLSKSDYTSSLSYCNNVLKVSFCMLKSEPTSHISSHGSISRGLDCTNVHWSSLPRCIPSVFESSNLSQGANWLPVCDEDTSSSIDVNFRQSDHTTVCSVMNGYDPNWGSESDRRQFTDSLTGSTVGVYQHSLEDISASDELDVTCSAQNVNQAETSNISHYSLDMSENISDDNSLNGGIDFLDNISLLANDDNSYMLSDVTGMSSFDSLGKGDQMSAKLSVPLPGTPAINASVLMTSKSHEVSFEKSIEMHEGEHSEISTQQLEETTEKHLMSEPTDNTVEKDSHVLEPKKYSHEVMDAENDMEDPAVSDKCNELQHDIATDRSLKEFGEMAQSNDVLLDDKTGFVLAKNTKDVNLLQSNGNDVNRIDSKYNYLFNDDNLESESEMSYELVVGLENWLHENSFDEFKKDTDQMNGNELQEQNEDNLLPNSEDSEFDRDDHDENNNIDVNKKDRDSSQSKGNISDFGDNDLGENNEEKPKVRCDKNMDEESETPSNLEVNKSFTENKIEGDEFDNIEVNRDVHISSEVDGENDKNSETEKKDDNENDVSEEKDDPESGIDSSYNDGDMLEEIIIDSDDEIPDNSESVNEEEEEENDDAISIYVSDHETAFLFDDMMTSDAMCENDRMMTTTPLGSDTGEIEVQINSETIDTLNKEAAVPSEVLENSPENDDVTIDCKDDVLWLTQSSTSQNEEQNIEQIDEGSFKTSTKFQPTDNTSGHSDEQMDVYMPKTSSNAQFMEDFPQIRSQKFHRKVKLVAEIPQTTCQNMNKIDICSYSVDDQHQNGQLTETHSQKACWVPKGYCYQMFNHGGCVGQCNYKHTHPTETDLQKSIPFIVDCIKSGDVDKVMCIMEDHIYFQQNLNPEVLNSLFDLCCRCCQQVYCQKLLFLFLSRGFVNRGHIDRVIFLWKNSCKDVEDLSPLQNALTVATRANILPQKDAVHILLQSFTEYSNVFCLWETIVFSSNHGFLVPPQYTLYGLDAAITGPNVALLHKVISWLKSVDRPVLESISDEMLIKLQKKLEELNDYDTASSIQYLIDSKHYEFTSTTSAPLWSRPVTPVLLGSTSHIQEHQELLISKRLGRLSGTMINSSSSPPLNRRIKLNSQSVVCSKPVELQTSMPLMTSMPSKDDVSFSKLIENASKTNNLKQLAWLFINRCITHGTVQPYITQQFLLALSKNSKVLGDFWRQFVELVSTSYFQKLSKNSVMLDTTALSFIGSEIFFFAYNKSMWRHASSILLTILGSDLLELSPQVERQRGISLIVLAMATFMKDKLPEKAAEVVQVFASHQLRIDVKTEMMSMFVTLMSELCERKKFDLAHQLLNTAFVWNFLGAHEMSSELINRCLRVNELDIPIEIYNYYLSHKIPFSIPANVKRIMMNMLLARKEFPMLADNLYNDIRFNSVLYTPQSFIKPRRLVLPTHYTCYEVCLVIRDYLLGLYFYFCDVWSMKHKLAYQELNLKVVLITEVDLSGDSMLQLLGELPLTMLSVKSLFLREFGLHSVSLGHRSEFVLQTASLEKYIKDLDQKNHNIGLEFSSSLRYR